MLIRYNASPVAILRADVPILVSAAQRGTSHYHTVKPVKEDFNCLVAVLWKAKFSLEKKQLPKADKQRLKQEERATSNEGSTWICQQWRAITVVAAPSLWEYAVSFVIKGLTCTGESSGYLAFLSTAADLLLLSKILWSQSCEEGFKNFFQGLEECVRGKGRENNSAINSICVFASCLWN